MGYQVIEVEGGAVVFEGEDVHLGIEAVGGAPEAPKKLREMLAKLRPTTDELMRVLQSLPQRPDEIEVAFGVKLSGEVGAIITKAATEGNFQIRLKWTPKPDAGS